MGQGLFVMSGSVIAVEQGAELSNVTVRVGDNRCPSIIDAALSRARTMLSLFGTRISSGRRCDYLYPGNTQRIEPRYHHSIIYVSVGHRQGSVTDAGVYWYDLSSKSLGQLKV
ncbi:hypothetical protein O9929_08035 [Vibrio lentus]|nr:hypothetical protein [Vibrio lentus]